MSLAFSPDHLSYALDGARGGAPPERSWGVGWSAACEGLEGQRSFLALVPAQLRAWDAWDRDADKNVHPVWFLQTKGRGVVFFFNNSALLILPKSIF